MANSKLKLEGFFWDLEKTKLHISDGLCWWHTDRLCLCRAPARTKKLWKKTSFGLNQQLNQILDTLNIHELEPVWSLKQTKKNIFLDVTWTKPPFEIPANLFVNKRTKQCSDIKIAHILLFWQLVILCWDCWN